MNIRVLHVDDEPDFAEVTAEFLKHEDDSFAVETATSASEALNQLAGDDFDCIVSDYDMPGQNGIEFLKCVRKRAPNLPFVLFTGKGSEEIAGEAISAGVTDYLQKNSGTDQYTVLANRLRNAVRRHRAEKDRKRQRKAIETAQEGISILNEAGEYIYVNQAYADMYGYEPDEMTGEHWNLIYPDDETAIARDVILPTVAQDGYWSGETTGLRSDGTTVLEDHTVAQTETGELICTVRDRSVEQKQAIALTQFRTLVETLNDPVYVLDETGEFEYVNDAFVEMVGYDRATIIGASPALIKSPEAIDRSETNLGRLLSSNGPDSVQFEIEVQPNHGEPIPCEDHMGVLPYEGESFEGSVGILREITERKEREQELEQTNTVLRTIVDNLPMGVLVEDAERDVLIANDQLGEALGVPIDSEELIGRDCAAAAEELKDRFTDSEAFIRGITERLEQQEAVQNEELLLADGRVVERDYVSYTLPKGEANLWLYRDVTTRKQRREELERSNQFLQETQNVAHVGGWEFNVQSESLQWSDEVYRIHGLPLDVELTLEDAFEFYHPDDRGTIREAFDRLRAEGEPYELELRIVTADGDIRWVSALGEPAYQGDKIVAVRGTVQDITERKEREQELQMVREQFEQFAGNVQDAFFLLSTDYSETEYVNSAVEQLYGITPEEAYDDPTVWLRHVHPDDKEELLADMEAQQDETSDWPIEQEFRIDHPDRGVQWVQARLNVIIDENGGPSRLTGVTTDITDRKQREESLNALLGVTRDLMNAHDKQTVAEQAVDAARGVLNQPINGLWLQDSEEKELKPVAVTAESTAVVGTPPTYSAGESLSWEAFTTNELKFYDDVRTHPERFNPETQIRSEIIIPLGEHGVMNMGATEPADFSEVDVSMARIFGKTVEMALDRAEREQRLRNQRSRLQQQNDHLDEFTGVVSHDLRNPLNVATGRLELATEECDSAHLDDVKQALNRMETLIDDLLMLAQEGKEVTDAQPVDLAAVATRSWENVETNQAKLLSHLDRTVCADKSRLKQVFENLFRNAVEHGRADVTVTIGELDDGFYIEDDGSGIALDERDAVFNAGYSQSRSGTGLGLSIVEQIVNAHGWHIRVTDGTDGGARFEITNLEFIDV